jgi:chromosome segregation protein
MRLKRIELIGFKSFADRTVLDFHPGITAIVGPNGCGKSNIVDAFKWVLGEQSAKSLRGDSMEDVIFFGSATRKTRGMAEVTLVLSGISVEGHDPDSEISVTRRLYRSGESEYLINKTPCRLKDIKDIFLDTGLELKAYSILEQGRMNDILNAKPQDRRFLIEEVAGVMKYKVRRAEAMQKLESSRYNLQRLEDIIAEVKRQMNSINRYARKAERYKRLLEEVRDIDIRIAKREIRRLTAEVGEASSTLEGLRQKETEVSTGLHSIEALTEKKRAEYIDAEKRLDEMVKRLHEVEKMVTEAEGMIALLRKECDNLRDRVDELRGMGTALMDERRDVAERLKRIGEELEEMNARLRASEEALKDKEERLRGLIDEITGLEALVDDLRRRVFTKAEEGSVLKNEIKHLSMLIDESGRKIERLDEEIASVERSLSGLDEEYAKTKGEYTELKSTLSELTEKREGLDRRLRAKKEELKDIEARLYSGREELAAMSSRYESIRELYTSQRVDIGGDIKTFGQIADILETTPEYESAIEAVLGDKLNALIVEGHDDILNALRRIKEDGAKRCGFISLNPPPIQRGDMQVADGVIHNAMDVVSIKDGFQAVVEALLGDVLIVKDIETAFRLRDRVNRYLYMATLDGEVLEPSGVVYGGVERGLLRIRRQLRELERGIETKRAEVARDEEAVAVLTEEIKRCEGDILSVEQEMSACQEKFNELRLGLERLREEREQQQKKLYYLKTEIQDERNEEEDMKALRKEKERRHRELEAEREDAANKLRDVQAGIDQKRGEMEKVRSELTEIKLSITSINERIKTLMAEKDRLDRRASEIEEKKEEIEGRIVEISEEIAQKEEEIRRREDAMKSSILQAKGLEDEIQRGRDLISQLSDEIEGLDQRHKGLSSEHDKLKDELKHLEMRKMELEMRLGYIREDIRKTYNVSIGSVDEAIEVSTEEEERLAQLKERLQEMGPVSLGTLEEYEELKTRYDFLKKQQDDLISSINTLEETIQRINRSTQKRLTEAFNALNEKFKEVFRTLFGEGRAELILTEGSILESGIEIVAQPPGKRLKSLHALSGGEQALVALSLLFAGFMVKPTPMCILDEVDAPLDESNTGRFVKMLSGLSKEIQFITITHNRLTMEVADYIYGVTMEEPGVSKVVSMHLAETA